MSKEITKKMVKDLDLIILKLEMHPKDDQKQELIKNGRKIVREGMEIIKEGSKIIGEHVRAEYDAEEGRPGTESRFLTTNEDGVRKLKEDPRINLSRGHYLRVYKFVDLVEKFNKLDDGTAVISDMASKIIKNFNRKNNGDPCSLDISAGLHETPDDVTKRLEAQLAGLGVPDRDIKIMIEKAKEIMGKNPMEKEMDSLPESVRRDAMIVSRRMSEADSYLTYLTSRPGGACSMIEYDKLIGIMTPALEIVDRMIDEKMHIDPASLSVVYRVGHRAKDLYDNIMLSKETGKILRSMKDADTKEGREILRLRSEIYLAPSDPKIESEFITLLTGIGIMESDARKMINMAKSGGP